MTGSRFVIALMLTASLQVGCQTQSSKADPKAAAPAQGAMKLAALDDSVGRVVNVNSKLRFAVLDFSLSRRPAPGERLELFHNGTVTGELKTGYHSRDNTIIADIVQGSPAPGDEVRPVRP